MDIAINVKDVVKKVIDKASSKLLAESQKANTLSWPDDLSTSIEILRGLEDEIWTEVEDELKCKIPEGIKGNSLNRLKKLMPNGQPRYVLCYDSGPEFFDRYTVVFTGRYVGRTIGEYQYVGMSATPFNPQGFCQHGEIDNYNGLGKKIEFSSMPEDCQVVALRDYLYYWGYCDVYGCWYDNGEPAKLCNFK